MIVLLTIIKEHKISRALFVSVHKVLTLHFYVNIISARQFPVCA